MLFIVFTAYRKGIFIITRIKFTMNYISDFLLHCRISRPGPADPYIKMVWADTYKVGCGYTGYFDPDSNSDHMIYACLYGPGGSTAGGNVYQIGSACSACPAGTTCEYDLCARTLGSMSTKI
jgi:hypothetical protein